MPAPPPALLSQPSPTPLKILPLILCPSLTQKCDVAAQLVHPPLNAARGHLAVVQLLNCWWDDGAQGRLGVPAVQLCGLLERGEGDVERGCQPDKLLMCRR